ncbi:voltage-gated potassium channel protein [Atlantibacter hermannii]|uniref:voltage-gated potassium channel protein n=1 Tax=Atlantibacter hermannii TaxID=565 RepID=UPI002FD885A1
MKKLLHRCLALFSAHGVLALLVAACGYLFLHPVLIRTADVLPRMQSFSTWKEALSVLGLLEIPQFVLGLGLILMAFGLLLRARTAWAFSLLLLMAVSIFNLLSPQGTPGLSLGALVLILLLTGYWRQFDRASLAAGGLFALVSFVSLLLYAVMGALYLGEQFSPAIVDMPTAFYFAIVGMSTVGFGDIIPVTSTSRLFTVSVIVMGITVFATSISAIIGPIIGGKLKRIVTGQISHVMRKNHFIIAGASPLALSVYHGLKARGEAVTVIVPPHLPHEYPPDTDLITGDPSNTVELVKAGAEKAKYILALRDDDAENAFIVLAAKEVEGKDTKTISVVNASKNLQKIKRVQPDMVFSLQTLGSELLVRTLNGEPIDNKLITALFFGDTAQHKEDAS